MRADICQPPPTATAERVSDAGITATIELFFLTEKGVAAHLIDVATHEGIVKLDGRIDNPLARERAAGIALTKRIRQRFFWSTSLHNQDVEVPIGQERTTLISTVDNLAGPRAGRPECLRSRGPRRGQRLAGVHGGRPIDLAHTSARLWRR